MTLADRVKQDLTSAMKAGEKDRVGALRLVLSELQKAQKEGSSDEVAVLRRERKRRQESAAAFRSGGRPELADAEDAEAEVIAAYLPAELSDDELRAIVGPPPKRVPPEPLRVAGAAAIRRALVAKEAAEQDGRDPNPVARALAALPAKMGMHIVR